MHTLPGYNMASVLLVTFFTMQATSAFGNEYSALYNSKVTSVQEVRRPIDGLPFRNDWLGLYHSGTKVETELGTYLIQKGYEYGGTGGNTVVVDDKYMSDKWQPYGDSMFGGGQTVGDLVAASGPGYNVILNNCHDGVERQLELLQPRQRRRRAVTTPPQKGEIYITCLKCKKCNLGTKPVTRSETSAAPAFSEPNVWLFCVFQLMLSFAGVWK